MSIAWKLAVVAAAAAAVRLYPQPNRPEENPVQARAWTKVPTNLGWNHSCKFCAYRGTLDAAALSQYNESGLGTVVWPQYTALQSPKLAEELAAFAKDYPEWIVADISNYVPGDDDACDPPPPLGVCEYKPPRAVIDLLVSTLGERFAGMDNGEQDGRYTAFAGQQLRGRGGNPTVTRPLELQANYLQFSRHFERMTDDLGSRMMSLNSLYYPHYFAKTGLYTMLGAETAQGLPNDQLFYAFLRGAAKQYGSLIWGDASVGNRWWGPEGPKLCPANAAGTECVCGTNGTSLALMRRLMYQQLMYNSAIFSFEGGYTCAAADGKQLLAPIGKIQLAGKSLAEDMSVGVHLAQFAVLLDFFDGFVPPRNLYSGKVYRVWANLPFDRGNFFTHGLFNTLFPHYADASYYHNESGFLTETPLGDAMDVLLSDSPLALLQRYPVVVVASTLRSMKAEIVQKLAGYCAAGGTLVVNALNAHALATSRSMFPAHVNSDNCTTVSEGTTISLSLDGEVNITEQVPVRACQIVGADSVPVAVTASGVVLAARFDMGNGTLYVLATDGVSATPQTPLPIENAGNLIDQPLPQPYPLASHVQLVLSRIMKQQQLFEAGTGLSVVVTRRGTGDYLVAVANVGLKQLGFKIALTTNWGRMLNVTEIDLGDKEVQSASGYTPTHTPAGTDLGKSTATEIAGLDQRIFRVAVQETNVQLLSPQHAMQPMRATALPVPAAATSSFQDQVLLRATFLQHVDTAVVDWRYVEASEVTALRREGRCCLMCLSRVVLTCISHISPQT
jgi:hypothetical protein